MIRIEFPLRRKPGMSRKDFQAYWRDIHGPLAARHSTNLGIHRYIQLHTLDDPINDALAEARGGMEEPYDGVAELWWTPKWARVWWKNSRHWWKRDPTSRLQRSE